MTALIYCEKPLRIIIPHNVNDQPSEYRVKGFIIGQGTDDDKFMESAIHITPDLQSEIATLIPSQLIRKEKYDSLPIVFQQKEESDPEIYCS